MLYQNSQVITEEPSVMYTKVVDPAEYLLEYRIIALDLSKDAEKAPYVMPYTDCSVSYSLLIILYDEYGGTETNFLYDVTRNLAVAKALQSLLCDGAVTPCSANDVIEDML